MGHSYTWAHVIQSYSQYGVICADWNVYWLQYSAVGGHPCWHCWTLRQACCWAAFKCTKCKCIIAFLLNFLVLLGMQYHEKWKLWWLLYVVPRIILLKFLGDAKMLNGKGKAVLWSGARCRVVMKKIFKTVLVAAELVFQIEKKFYMVAAKAGGSSITMKDIPSSYGENWIF